MEGIEERWRDDLIWLLSGLSKILDLRCFYYHLQVACMADAERIKRVKKQLGRMRHQTFELQDQLKYCSPLGPMLTSIRRTRRNHSRPSIGIGTIRRLEEAGIHRVTDLATLNPQDLINLGIRRDFAHQIHHYIRQRLQ